MQVKVARWLEHLPVNLETRVRFLNSAILYHDFYSFFTKIIQNMTVYVTPRFLARSTRFFRISHNILNSNPVCCDSADPFNAIPLMWHIRRRGCRVVAWCWCGSLCGTVIFQTLSIIRLKTRKIFTILPILVNTNTHY